MRLRLRVDRLLVPRLLGAVVSKRAFGYFAQPWMLIVSSHSRQPVVSHSPSLFPTSRVFLNAHVSGTRRNSSEPLSCNALGTGTHFSIRVAEGNDRIAVRRERLNDPS